VCVGSDLTARFGGFASVSMHDPNQAAQELKRAVRELGLLGVMLNDFQEAEKGTKMLWYDQPEYDPFWAMVQELDGKFLNCSSNNSTLLHSPSFADQRGHRSSLGGSSCLACGCVPVRDWSLSSCMPRISNLTP
jgi:predicted TIM-barrel fold metal-dependent hydrolase